MLNKLSYVFIIGAGAGKPYGFPLGIELYDKIRDNYAILVKGNRDFGTSFQVQNYVREAENFVQALEQTTGISIDKYLNINEKYYGEGKTAIAALIYQYEQKSELPLRLRLENDWYTNLYIKLIEGLKTADDLMRIGENKVSFIIFNYDRSLEYYLFENLFGLVNNTSVCIDRKQVAEALKPIDFIHVYGQIGKLPWQEGIYNESPEILMYAKENVLKYGEKNYNQLNVAYRVKGMIDLMYNSRKDNPEIVKAQKLIESADKIMFLGFGYDDDNLAILNLPELLEGKTVYGTAYENTNNEISNIKSKLIFRKVNSDSEIYPCNCLMLLREHLI